MLNPISPQLVRVIHDEKISNLEREIAIMRIAKERGEYGLQPAWYARAAQWVKGKLAVQSAAQSAAAQAVVEEPCPVVPC